MTCEIKQETLQVIKEDLGLLVAARYLKYDTKQAYVDTKENSIVLTITISDMSKDPKALIKEASEHDARAQQNSLQRYQVGSFTKYDSL